MVGRDNVTFRFRIDSAKAEQALLKLEQLVRKLGGTSDHTSGKMRNLSTATNQMGNNAAASAVNFQTATQGMLNLSTAAVQTFTSISNLDRANNRAKMSMIAVARAEDLLANKKERLNDLIKSGMASEQKVINIRKEIATATADLTVKEEKMGIEKGAVNDIYMLFATNIANVTISSMQTLAILDRKQILLSKGRVIAQKLVNFSTWENVRATKTKIMADRVAIAQSPIASFGYKSQAFALKGLTLAQRMSTGATRVGTMALHGLKIALGPIGLIFIGISAAMVAYEANLGGVKDTINGLLGIKDDFEESLERERELTQGLTEDNNRLAESFKKLIPAHKAYIKMMRDAALNRGEMGLAAQFQSQILQPKQGFSQPSVIGGLPTRGVDAVSSISGTSTRGDTTASGVINGIPLTDNKTVSHIIGVVKSDILDFQPDPFGTGLERQSYQALRPSEKVKILEQLSVQKLAAGEVTFATYYSDQADKLRSVKDNLIETDPVKALKNIITDVKVLDEGVGFFTPKRRLVTAEMQRFKFGIDIATRMGINPKTNRGVILNQTGRDLGPIADSLEISSARSLAHLRGRTTQFNQMGGAGRMTEGLQLARDIQEFTHTAKVSRPAWAIAEGKARMSFANGVGRIYANIVNSLISIGGTGRTGRSAASARRHLQKDRKFLANRGYIQTARLYGFTQNEDFMARLEESVVSTNGDIAQSQANFTAAAELAQEFIEFQFTMLKSIGIDSRSASAIAKEIGMDSPLAIDAGFLQNAALVAQMNQSDFDNTNIIHESKTKLNMSNQEVFAIRFNGKRGDEELLDRIRFQDRLEAMSTGTSAF